jgi:hypothetical protein
LKKDNLDYEFALAPDYDNFIKNIPYGKIITSDSILQILSKKYGEEILSPLTAVFITIRSNAIEEQKEETPYWRVLKKNGELNKNNPYGIEEQKKRLEAEGLKVIQKGKKYYVLNYQDNLYSV